MQVCYILDKLTEIGFRYIFCFPEDGNDIAITFSVRNKQTNKETGIYMKRLVIAICLESMQYSETMPYGHRGNTAVWSLRYLAPFLAAWQNGNTFSCKKPSLIRSSINLANLFWPISDHINGVPLYFQINQQSNHFFFL